MSISFACDFCSRKYRVGDELAGRKVKCKECGAELTIPHAEPAFAAKPAPPPADDRYGFEDEAPTPPPGRAGASAETPSRGGRPRKRSRPTSEGSPGLRQAGTTMMVLGGLSFVLPFVGLQVKGLHALSPEAQATGGAVLLALGLFCVVVSAAGALQALIAGGIGAAVLLIGVGVFLNKKNAAQPAAVAGGPAIGQPAANPPPPGVPPMPAPPPAIGQPGPAPVHVTLSNGQARASETPLGSRMPGVTFHAEYQLNGPRPVGGMTYHVVVKGSRAQGRSGFTLLRDSGEINVSGMSFTQADGPFEMSVVVEEFGIGGRRSHTVSNSIPLPWVDAPPPQPSQPPPGFGPNGRIPGPGGMPGQPGYRPPGMPGPGQPGFGRGRRF